MQAIKQNKLLWWIAYSLASILALYTSTLSGLFIFSHFVYILLFKKEIRLKSAFCLFFIVIAYLPWIHFLYTVREVIRSGLSWHIDEHPSIFSLELLFFQLLGFVRSFMFLFDFSMYFMMFRGTLPAVIFTVLLIDLILLSFILYAFFYLVTKTTKEIRWFCILLILPMFLVFYISDIIRHGFTSILWRYQIISMAGISIIVTSLLQDNIAKGKLFYLGIYLVLVILGVTSILKIEKNRCWMTRPDCESNIQEAQLISQARRPLLITDFSGWGFINFLAVINESKVKDAAVMYCKGTIPDIREKIAGKAYSDIYVIQASDTLVQHVKTQFGESMLPYRKEVNVFSQQIWQIKF